MLARRQITVAVGITTIADFGRTKVGCSVLLIAVVIIGYITRWLTTFTGTRTRSTATVAVVVSPVHVTVPTTVAVVAVEASIAACGWCASVLLAVGVDPVFEHLKLIGVQAISVGTMMRTNGLAVEDRITGAALA